MAEQSESHENPEQRFEREVLERLSALESLAQQSLENEQAILKAITALQKPTEVISIKFKDGETTMALTLPLGNQAQGFVTATIDNHDGKGPVAQTALPAGQTLTIVSADPATFTVAVDNPAVQDPDGTASVASFVVAAVNPPAQPNVPVNITVTVTNADGSQAAAPLVDTVTVSESATEVIGDLFENPVAIPPPASAKKK